MPKGNCNPAPDPYNEMEIAYANAQVVVTIRWTWDGVSVFPDCDGTVIYIRTRNLAADVTYYAHLPHKARGVTYLAIDPLSDTTITTANTLRQLGLDTYKECLGVRIDADPNSVGD